ncbi:hypothetical protein CCR75_000761 [Bremia lactucae]|uniref:Uncharacterized protein n=1 Tax=Bremia lactucae TaxID=4779 RepID=A0A976IHH9_BRELC|nr:hypothetical protein CCR75_000761 [Bremia lactucae]
MSHERENFDNPSVIASNSTHPTHNSRTWAISRFFPEHGTKAMTTKRTASLCCLLLLSCYHLVTFVQKVARIEAPIVDNSRQLRANVELEERTIPAPEGLIKQLGAVPARSRNYFQTQGLRVMEQIASWKWIIKSFPRLHVRFAKDKVAAAATVFPNNLLKIKSNLFGEKAFQEWVTLVRRSIKGPTDEADGIITAVLVRKFGNVRAIQLVMEGTSKTNSVNAKWLLLLENYFVQANVNLPKLLEDIFRISNQVLDEKMLGFVIKVGSVKQHNQDAAYVAINDFMKSKHLSVELHKLEGDVKTYGIKWYDLKKAYRNAMSDSKTNANVAPIDRLMKLADSSNFQVARPPGWKIANNYAQSSENLEVLRIAIQAILKNEGADAHKAKVFAIGTLKHIGLKWEENNFDIGKMLKTMVGTKGNTDELLQTPQAWAVIHAVTAAHMAKVEQMIRDAMKHASGRSIEKAVLDARTRAKPEGVKKAVQIFLDTFGHAKISTMLTNSGQTNAIVKEFNTAYRKLHPVPVQK